MRGIDKDGPSAVAHDTDIHLTSELPYSEIISSGFLRRCSGRIRVLLFTPTSHQIAMSPVLASLLVVIAFFTNAAALPTETKTDPSFVPEPRGRGTVGLLVSCVLTIILCVWTAVHVNILANRTPWNSSVQKLKWVVIGLLTPEVILWAAFEQWCNACAVLKAARDISKTRTTSQAEDTQLSGKITQSWT